MAKKNAETVDNNNNDITGLTENGSTVAAAAAEVVAGAAEVVAGAAEVVANAAEAVGGEKVADGTTPPAATGEVVAPVVKLDIVRGRMPLPIVKLIKFDYAEMTDGALAAKFRTTNGKVSDIRKDRNFGYVKKDYAPSADMIAKAKEFAKQLPGTDILEKLEAMPLATEAQAIEFEAIRKLSRPGRKPATPAAPPAAGASPDATATGEQNASVAQSAKPAAGEAVTDADLASLTE